MFLSRQNRSKTRTRSNYYYYAPTFAPGNYFLLPFGKYSTRRVNIFLFPNHSPYAPVHSPKKFLRIRIDAPLSKKRLKNRLVGQSGVDRSKSSNWFAAGGREAAARRTRLLSRSAGLVFSYPRLRPGLLYLSGVGGATAPVPSTSCAAKAERNKLPKGKANGRAVTARGGQRREGIAGDGRRSATTGGDGVRAFRAAPARRALW